MTQGRPRTATLRQIGVDAMGAHIEELCEQNEIDIDFIQRPGRARAAAALQLIRIAPIRSAISYATALHEIGHVVGPLQWAGVLKREEGAWRWAERNALVWTDWIEQHRQSSMAWYRREAEKRGRRWATKMPAHRATGSWSVGIIRSPVRATILPDASEAMQTAWAPERYLKKTT
jgi:hypothetical protein